MLHGICKYAIAVFMGLLFFYCFVVVVVVVFFRRIKQLFFFLPKDCFQKRFSLTDHLNVLTRNLFISAPFLPGDLYGPNQNKHIPLGDIVFAPYVGGPAYCFSSIAFLPY